MVPNWHPLSVRKLFRVPIWNRIESNLEYELSFAENLTRAEMGNMQ